MEKEIRKQIEQFHMLKKGDRLLIGLSGGADSICLAQILYELATEYELELKKVLLRPGTDVDLFELSDFSVLIAKPGHHVLYSGCEWKEIEESLTLGEPCYGRMVLSAKKRMVLEAKG